MLQRFFKGDYPRRRKLDLVVAAGSTHVGELLGLADIDVQIPLTRVLSHYLTFLDLYSRLDEEPAAVLKLVH